MGNCVSAQDREALQRSQEIDKQIEEDSRKFKKECKILLLGSGESGKSAIVKQVRACLPSLSSATVLKKAPR